MAKKPTIDALRLQSGTKGPVLTAWRIQPAIVADNSWPTTLAWYNIYSHRREYELGLDAAGQYALITADTPVDADGEYIGVMTVAVGEDALIDAADKFSKLIRADRLARRAAV